MRKNQSPDECQRLAALREYRILDTPPEQVYDDIARLAAHVCRVPMAMISLVDVSRQWFKSRLGILTQETCREVSFCTHTILMPKPLIVPDATKDARFANSPLVKEDPHIRFYAGFPLLNPEGVAVGSLCAVDNKPRRISAAQQLAMEALARQVMALLELRRVSARLAHELEHVKTLQGLLPICAWCKRIRDDHGYWTKVEAYLQANTDADFTHGICPDCLDRERVKAGHQTHDVAA